MVRWVRCDCKDCLNTFYAAQGHHYSDDHYIAHHPKCNHITQKDFDKVVSEDEVWVDDIGIYVKKMVGLWSGYRCTCEQVFREEE